MHELSLCRSIYGIATRAAGDRKVSTVYLDIGKLRQVIPQTLEYCWGLVVEDTVLEGSELVISHVPAVIECNECSTRSDLQGIPMMVCSNCGSGSVTVISGDEFLLRSLDVKDE